MKKRTKILVGLSGTVVILAIAAVGVVYYLLVKSLPQSDGKLAVSGISSEIEIIRDNLGVPHVVASTDYDAYYAMGFVHAQDRLWQMDLTRRYGQGRLAEIFGAVALPVDKLMRTVNISAVADSLYRFVSPQTRNILDAYTRGVNDCIEVLENRYPVEFDLLGYTPEPWTPQHSLIVARMMAWEMALSWWSDLTMADMVARLGAEKALQAIPLAGHYLSVEALKKDSALFADTRIFSQTFQNFPRLMRSVNAGSNSWVVTGAKSVSGKPIFANDPHLMVAQPARWYLVHIVAPGMNLSGATIPGAPGVVIGSNGHIAWGITNAMADDTDFFVERVDIPDSLYQTESGLERLTVRMDSIFIRDSAAIEYRSYATRNGPVITIDPEAGEFLARGELRDVVSMRWAGVTMSDEFLALFQLNRARSWEGFRSALAHFGTPCQRWMYADTAGNIGVSYAGFIPLRPARNAMLPMAGWKAPQAWNGMVPYAMLPQSLNPETEYLAAANAAPEGELQFFLSSIYESDSRVRRIEQLIQEQPMFNSNDFRLMQMDYTSPYAAGLRDAFVHALVEDPDRSLEVTWAMNVLASWDLRMSPSSVAAGLYNAAYQSLLEETFRDELGEELFHRYVLLANIPTRSIVTLLGDTTTTWFDNVTTRSVETKDDILRRSVRKGMQLLQERLGSSMNEWRWGSVHAVTFAHPMGAVEPLDRIFNVGPLSVGGNNTTINNSEYRFTSPYGVQVAASLRFIADMAAPDTCSFVLTTGQSGQPLSEHYADQSGLWQNGAYHLLLRNMNVIRNKGWPVLRLVRK